MRMRVLVFCGAFTSLLCLGPPGPASAGKPVADTVQPKLLLSSPADQQRTTVPSIEIIGSVTDNVGVASATVSLNGANPVVLSPDRAGNFQTTATLLPGATALVVKAADRAGNVASASRTVYYDPPPLEIVSPTDGAVIDAGWIDLQGRKTGTIVRVAAGAALAELTTDTFRVERIQLSEGLNTIKAVGVDAAGNRTEDAVQVTCTSTQEAFKFTATSPAGSPPFTATFSWVQNTSGTVSSVEVDVEGTGIFVPAPGGIAGMTHTYAAEGTYYPTVRVLMADGLRFTHYLTLSVYSPARYVSSFPAAEPSALAVDATGRLFVLERGADRVRVFDRAGVETTQFGSSGSAPGQFARPTGLSLDGAGNVYVADTENHRVQKFSPTFEHLKTFGRQGTRLGELDQPRAIAVDLVGNLFVTEGGNRRVQQFDRLGNSVRAWGSDVLVDPWGIVSFQSGTLAVTDQGGGGPLVFSDSGTQSSWSGTAPALQGPAGIASDQERQEIAVADAAGNRVVVLSSAGTLVREATVLDGDSLGLSAPLAVVRTPHPTEERYFIADSGHGRVVTISFSGTGTSGPIEAAWAGMKSALFSGNVEAALLFFAEESREQYRGIFAAVADQLASAQQLASGPLLPLKIDQDQAEYGLFVLEQGTQVMYRVQFVRDGKGAWKILHW
jgi:NHL repeat/Glucodextranase, domain B